MAKVINEWLKFEIIFVVVVSLLFQFSFHFHFKFVEKSYLILVKNGSHMVIMESHETVNEVIFEFLNDQYPV